MPGEAGAITGQTAGEGYVPDDELWEGGNTSQSDIDKAGEEAGGEAFLADWGGASQIGSAGGMIGGIIGGVVGLVMGLIDAGVTKQAVIARLSDEAVWRAEMEKELEDLHDMRDDIERNLSALLHPLEQQYRVRARLFGARARAQGLVGAQALSAQVLAEEQYRQTVGPQMAGIYQEAANATQIQQMGRLKAIETKYGIQLDRDRLILQQEAMLGSAQGQFLGGLGAGLSAMGSGISGLIQEGMDAKKDGGADTSDLSGSKGANIDGDTLGGGTKAGNADIAGGVDDAKFGNEEML